MQLGAHISTAGGVTNAVVAGAEIGCEMVQVFTKNQPQWKAPPLDDDEVARWHQAIHENGGPKSANQPRRIEQCPLSPYASCLPSFSLSPWP